MCGQTLLQLNTTWITDRRIQTDSNIIWREYKPAQLNLNGRVEKNCPSKCMSFLSNRENIIHQWGFILNSALAVSLQCGISRAVC